MGAGGASSKVGGRSSRTRGVSSAAAFAAPSMSGTPRQIEYATDLLKRPYDAIGLQADFNESMNKQTKASLKGNNSYLIRANALRAAQSDYANQVKQLGSQVPNLSASQIIDRKSGFMSLAKEIARRELKNAGVDNFVILGEVDSIR